MGVDLCLCPEEYPSGEWSLCLTYIELGRAPELTGMLPMGERRATGWFGTREDGEREWGDFDTDPYGDPAQFIWSDDLAAQLAECEPAAAAYLEKILRCRVILWWH